MNKLGLLLLFFALITKATASISFNLGGDKLYNDSFVPIPENSLVMLIADTGGNGFGSAIPGEISVGGFLDGVDDKILFIGSTFNGGIVVSSPVLELDNTTPGTTPGQWRPTNDLALVWFVLSSDTSTLTPGDHYGIYYQEKAGTTLYSGSNNWVTPADSTTAYSLFFYTESANLVSDGNNPDSAGLANLQVVPEPSVYAALLGGLALLVALRRRRTV